MIASAIVPIADCRCLMLRRHDADTAADTPCLLLISMMAFFAYVLRHYVLFMLLFYLRV